jgi:repressor LexA
VHLTRRQKEILDFIRGYVDERGYAPSLAEIGVRFGLSSVATVHKHVQNLVEKGLLRKAWNRSRSIELVEPVSAAAVEIPLLGRVAAGAPIEAVATSDSLAVPAALVGNRPCYALRVSGDSMVDEHILDGDFVILETRKEPRPGEAVVALIRREDVTLKRFYPAGPMVRLVPANPALSAMEFPAEDVELQGVVVGVIRSFGRP